MIKGRILLVEDDRNLAELIGFHFERAGFGITRTGDGEEALILAEESRPDLIILDWMIEGISGMCAVRGSDFNRRATSVPSSPGSIKSSRIRSGV